MAGLVLSVTTAKLLFSQNDSCSNIRDHFGNSIVGSKYKNKATDDYEMISIPQGKIVNCSSLPDLQGAWTILQPIQADLQLVQSGHLVSGPYRNAKIKGTIEGTLFVEEDIIFIGKWADQLGRGDFRVFVRSIDHHQEKTVVKRTLFQGNWRHSQSRIWDGEFLGEKR
jgi:hypothetical protein